jgi:hypothetical protein
LGGGPDSQSCNFVELASYDLLVSGLVDSSFFAFFKLFFAIFFSLSNCPSGAVLCYMQLASQSVSAGLASAKLFGIFSLFSTASRALAGLGYKSLILSLSVEIFSGVPCLR